ncbi:MAG: cell division protein FtsQ [Elusimicrobia bacterium]|nr:cell division protein FtsQ [Elusimicrobiota bacterium]MDE2313653.1 cell division protein FtsQ [Elusimicrobiota bacterium]
MRLKSRIRRGRAAPRPIIQKQARQKLLAAAAVLVLGACAAAAAAHFGRQWIGGGSRPAAAKPPEPSRPQSYPKTAAARVTQKGKPLGFLSENGRVFQAPASLYAGAVPQVEIGGLDPAGLGGVAKFLEAVARSHDASSALVRLSYVSPQDGWKALFADGTQAEWGDFRWTDLKLERMRQVLEDAKNDLSGPANVDLRYFGDGRIILRTAPAKSVSMR